MWNRLERRLGTCPVSRPGLILEGPSAYEHNQTYAEFTEAQFMPNRVHSFRLLLSILIVSAASPVLLSRQSSDPCKDVRAQQAWDDAKSPVYADATELARTLSRRGFIVECIRRSKEENLFEGQKGAAWYKTDKGIFEVWFLPKTESFAGLEVIEIAQENGRYAYSFKGTPRILTHMNSPKKMFFIKQANLLFEVWGDEQLAATLSQAFQNS